MLRKNSERSIKMKNRLHQVGILLLVAVLLFSGCGQTREDGPRLGDAVKPGFEQHLSEGEDYDPVPYRDMVYTTPDIEKLEGQLLAVQTLAEDTPIEDVMEKVYDFYDTYYEMGTNYNLAFINYCKDITDAYWDEAYTESENLVLRADATMEELLRYLADSPFREALESEEYYGADFFDAYDGEALWSDEYMTLMNQQTELMGQYYEIMAEAAEDETVADPAGYYSVYGQKMAEVYVQLVALRQQIAAYMGYDNYCDYAYEQVFYRDYTPEEAYAYTAEIAEQLVPLYSTLAQSDVWYLGGGSLTEKQNFAFLSDLTASMGGILAEAFEVLKENEVYDISYNPKKYEASYCTYLDHYYVPYIFIDAQNTVMDKLSLVHEFGHFTANYVAGGSFAGIDVAEVFSQALEYLSLDYGKGMEDLARLKMADSLCTYVEQAAFAAFEYEVFHLSEEELTVENVCRIFDSVGERFGLKGYYWNSLGFVDIPHFFSDPNYVISYVVSNDLSMQIYQKEQEKTGAGVALFEEFAPTDASYIVTFAEEMGLESPFAPGRLQEVAEIIAPYL